MKNIYYVFEQCANPDDYSWYLKGIFTPAGFVRFQHELKMIARNMAMQNLKGEEPMVPEKPYFYDSFDCEAADLQMKALRKQVNKMRLAGDFDKFVALGQEVHDIRERKKACVRYDKANCANSDFWERMHNILLGHSDTSPDVRFKLEDIESRMAVFKAEVEDDIIEHNMYLTLYLTRESRSEPVYVSYTQPAIEDYPPYKKALSVRQKETEVFTNGMNNAEKDYKNLRAKLDTMDKSDPEFKRVFKAATDAYYKMNHLRDMLENSQKDMDAIDESVVRKFNSQVRKETLRLDCILRDEYHTCRCNQALYWGSDVPHFNSMRSIRSFGSRVTLF